MEPESVLKQFGFTDTEVKVYLALLKLGETTGSEIAAKIEVHRTNVYDALNKLGKNGLVAHVKKKNKTVYSPHDPQHLYEILENRKENLDFVFPLLTKFYKSKKTQREIKILNGKDGVKTLLNDMYVINKDLFLIGSSMQMFSVMEHRVIQFLKKIKNWESVISIIAVDKENVRKRADEMQKHLATARFRFYDEKYLSPVVFGAYGDKLSLIIWEEEPVVIIIEDKSISKAFKHYFDMIWMISKE